MTRARVWQLTKFLAAGLPSFVLAVPLNYVLVDVVSLPKAPAYALVLSAQVTINFFVLRAFVFAAGEDSDLARDFFTFLAGILLFRLADWLVYVLLVERFGAYYLAAQLLNVVVFSVAKFWFAERVLDAA